MRDPKLTQRAKGMRKEMTEPETRLWLQLRSGRFHSIKFRRQKVIGNYIADFASNDPKLVIELDGDTHAGQKAYDVARTALLENQGYRVVRFFNSDVMGNLEGVLIKLSRIIEEMENAPPPTPSPEGEGA